MLIFGGTGFLGKHLCVMLHNRTGSDVTVVSRTPDTEFLNRFAPSVRAVNISDFLRSPESVRWDHRNIVYLAGTSTPGTFAAAPWKEFSENVAPTFHLFEQLHRTFPAAKLVYVSSSPAPAARSTGAGTPGRSRRMRRSRRFPHMDWARWRWNSPLSSSTEQKILTSRS